MNSAPMLPQKVCRQGLKNLAQRGRLWHRREGLGLEYLTQIRLGKAVVKRLEFRHRRTFRALQRIQLRPAIAEEAVGIDQLQNLDLLSICLCRGSGRRLQSAILGALCEGGDHRIVGHIRPRIVAGARQGCRACRNNRARPARRRPDWRGRRRKALRCKVRWCRTDTSWTAFASSLHHLVVNETHKKNGEHIARTLGTQCWVRGVTSRRAAPR
jgi:hypothetical protein